MLIYIVCICVYAYTAIHQLRASAFIENSKFLLLFLIVSAYLKNSIFLTFLYFDNFIQKKEKHNHFN